MTVDEALAEIQRALALDPLSTYKICGAGMIYSDRREYDRAVEPIPENHRVGSVFLSCLR